MNDTSSSTSRWKDLSVQDRVWIPLDVPSFDEAKKLIDALIPLGVKNFKVGLELISHGLAFSVITHIHTLGGKVFYDGKFSDIPNTVAGAARGAVGQGAFMFNLHANCGRKSIEAVVKNKGGALVLAVTVLTSLDIFDLNDIGFRDESPRYLVEKQTVLAKSCGVDGIICSPQEIVVVRDVMPEAFILTPGVRPLWASAQDQKRVMTPAEAIKEGATALVIGRPITNPPVDVGGPAEAAKLVFDEIASALVSIPTL